jgi:hypothetical protein
VQAERPDHLLGALAALDDSLNRAFPDLSQGGVGELPTVERFDASLYH